MHRQREEMERLSKAETFTPERRAGYAASHAELTRVLELREKARAAADVAAAIRPEVERLFQSTAGPLYEAETAISTGRVRMQAAQLTGPANVLGVLGSQEKNFEKDRSELWKRETAAVEAAGPKSPPQSKGKAPWGLFARWGRLSLQSCGRSGGAPWTMAGSCSRSRTPSQPSKSFGVYCIE